MAGDEMNLNGKVTNPGELRTKVTIQTRTITADAGGAQVPSWATLAVVWAKWQNVHGQELMMANSVEAERGATATIRYRNSIDETCSVLLGAKRFEITSIDNLMEKNEYLELRLRRMEPG